MYNFILFIAIMSQKNTKKPNVIVTVAAIDQNGEFEIPPLFFSKLDFIPY